MTAEKHPVTMGEAMNIEIHQITGGSHVIGPNGTVINNGVSPDHVVQAVAALMEALRLHRGELADLERTSHAAQALREEIRGPRPVRDRVLGLLRDIAAGTGDVAAVATAIQGVATAVHTLS